MTKSEFRFQIGEGASMPAVEDSLLMSVIAAEGIHGRAKVKLQARFNVDLGQRICTINADNQVGGDIAKIFVEFLLLDNGDDAFRIVGMTDSGCRCSNLDEARR